MGEINGDEGERRLRTLRENAIYVRRHLKRLGFFIMVRTCICYTAACTLTARAG